REEGIKVQVIPGASAVTAGLALSGMPAGSFIFLGFLPRKSGKIKTLLESAKNFCKTVVIYESPHRILKLLEMVTEIFGTDANISVSREITKAYEETVRGNAEEVLKNFQARKKILGEFVLIIEAPEKEKRVKVNKYDKNT
ncbi:MAG: 16S rRNA (cytidine(1402)-2'-O)-methyltransferase, partial [Elusimicrobiaceae bacterium]|nr:16S rRNA (cytidine(1402)-2'-O)-methyltransferase [Elusimicrobiaceae bacterium]